MNKDTSLLNKVIGCQWKFMRNSYVLVIGKLSAPALLLLYAYSFIAVYLFYQSTSPYHCESENVPEKGIERTVNIVWGRRDGTKLGLFGQEKMRAS